MEQHLHQSPDADEWRSSGWWREETLTDVVRGWVSTRPDACAVVDRDRKLTWRELWSEVADVAAALIGMGAGRGHIVSTQLPNSIDIVVMHLAIEALGAIHNPLAVQLREHELDQIGGLLDPRLVVYPNDGSEDYHVVHSRTRAGRMGRSRSMADVKRSLGNGALEVPRRTTAPDAAFILNTSGTVSMKGVVHTHEDAMYSTRVVGIDILGLGTDDGVLCVIPMTWGGGLEWGLRLALHTGAKLVVAPRWNAAEAIELIEREDVTFLYGPPTVASDLLRMAGQWRPSRPVSMICAGAPIPRQLARDAREQLGISLLPGYGQTEHFHSTLARPSDSFERIIGADGRAIPGVQVRAVSGSTGEPVSPGTIGEIECRGPNVGAGYWNQPELTAATFRADGWQVTQDLGVIDAMGYLQVSGRKRDLIIRGGLNVSPREVEELVARHPDVREAAVVGVADPRYGERVCVFVVPSAGRAPDVAELSCALTEMGVARFKHPELVRSIDNLPLTTTGKVRHQALRELLAAERGTVQPPDDNG